ncbi:hypothetical protein AWZ03_010901 [Drosophila navojoa]|uniref:TLC domain-containing protein n=1 Tax=Drosophila navojoa TaxID=7232 RepID=A0A484B4D1_DRONA|nr:hypothetical protein AWZ03_010901 [Drosophila navojoa]
MGCQERFVANEMQKFPPCDSSIAERHFAFCLCKKHSQRQTSLSRRRTPGQRMFEQLLVNDGKPERLLVPDLATDWFRKQKVFLDKVTSKEQLQMQLAMQLEDFPSQFKPSVCDCKRCSCNGPKVPESIQYLDYCQELRRRRQHLQRQRHHKRLDELLCDCHNPPTWPHAKRQRVGQSEQPLGNEQAKPKPKPEAELEPEPDPEPAESSKANKITVCPTQIAGCMPDTSAEGTRFTGGLSMRSKDKICPMYPHRTCCCLRARRRKSCGCIYQADGQPMGDECIAACRRFESPLPRLRQKYNLREVPQRRLNPACFRRISPEFYGLLQSYEDGMSKRYPLYGVPLRCWCKTMPCCGCEQPATDVCEQPCLGDQGLEACVGYPAKKDQPLPTNDDKDTESSEPIQELPPNYTEHTTFCDDEICKVYKCPDLVCTSEKCQQNACDENCESKEQHPDAELESKQADQTICTRSTCPARSHKKNERKTGESPSVPNTEPISEAMLDSRSLVPSQSTTVGVSKAGPEGVPRCCYPKQWFFKNKIVRDSSACMGVEPEVKSKRKGILGSVAGLCKRAIMPGRYLLYSLSTLHRPQVAYGDRSAKKQRLLKEPPKEKEEEAKSESFFSSKSKSSNWSQIQSQGTLWHSSASCSIVQNKCGYLKRKPIAGQFGKLGSKWMSANKINLTPSFLPHRQKFLMVQGKRPEWMTPPTTEIDPDPDPAQGQPRSTQLEEATNEGPAEEQEAVNHNAVFVNTMSRANEKPSTSKAARASYVPKTDYSQLMHLVARKRAKTAHYKRCTVSFAEKQRINGRQPTSLRLQRQQTRSSKRQHGSSPERRRSASPVPMKKQRTMDRADTPMQIAEPVYSKSLSSVRPRANLQAPSTTWLSAYSDDSISLKDQFMSCESQESKKRAPPHRQDKDSSDTQPGGLKDHHRPAERALPDKEYEPHGQQYSSCTSRMARLYNANAGHGIGMQVTNMGEKYPRKVFDSEKVNNDQNFAEQPQHHRTNEPSANNVLDFKSNISNETSMDTVEHNAERVAKITHYVQGPSHGDLKMKSISNAQKTESHGLPNIILSTRSPNDKKIIKLRDTVLKLPKVKVKYPNCKAHSLLSTRRPPPPPSPPQHFRVNQVKMLDDEQWRQLLDQANRNYINQQKSMGRGRRYDSGRDNDNDSDNDNKNANNKDENENSYGGHMSKCRSRSGCDVQFQDNDSPSNPIKQMPKTLFNNPTALGFIGRQVPLPKPRTYASSSYELRDKKIYTAPSSLKSSANTESRIDSNSQKSKQLSSSEDVRQQRERTEDRSDERSKRLPVERYQKEPAAMRPPLVTTSEFLGRNPSDVINAEYGNRAVVRMSANNTIDCRDVEYVHTPGRRQSAMLPAFSESFGYPEPSRRHSQSSIDDALPSIKQAGPPQRSSILKSALRPLSNMLKQATDVRHVNFANTNLSDLVIPSRSRRMAYYDMDESTPQAVSMHSGKHRPTIARVKSSCQSVPHKFSFTQPNRSKCIQQPLVDKADMPSIFSLPTTSFVQQTENIGDPTAYMQSPTGHERLPTRKQELEELDLPTNSQLLTKPGDIPRVKRVANDRKMPRSVSIISDLDFNAYYSPPRHVTKKSDVDAPGTTTTTDADLLFTNLLDRMKHKCRGCSTNTCPPTAECRLPPPERFDDDKSSESDGYSKPTRVSYPCSPHKLMGNTHDLGVDCYPKRSCCLRQLPKEPIVIQPTTGGLRLQQLRQKSLPTLFYGRRIVSAIQASFSFLVGLIVCKSTCSKSFVYASHFLMEAYGWFGTAYFMYDIWSMYKVHTQKIADKLHLLRLTKSKPFANGHARKYYDKAGGVGGGDRGGGNNNGSTPSTPHEICDYDGACVQIPKDGRWDFLKYVLTHPVMMIHHVFIGTFGLLVVTYIRGGGHCIYSYMFMMEFSTPFVSLRSILSTMGLKDSRAYIVNGLLMLVTFFVCRVCMWPYVMWRYSLAIDAASMWSAMCGLPRGCLISMAILFLPQLYWFYLMFMGALKVFLPKRQKQPSTLGTQSQPNALTDTPTPTAAATPTLTPTPTPPDSPNPTAKSTPPPTLAAPISNGKQK